MLEASKLSFDKGDNSGFIKIFSKAVKQHGEFLNTNHDLAILTSDDLSLSFTDNYDYYDYEEYQITETYNKIYKAKIQKMDAEKIISDAKTDLIQNQKKSQESNINDMFYDYDDLER